MIFQAAEVVAPEGAGPFTGWAVAGGEVEADAEEGGLGEWGLWEGRGSGFWLGLVLGEDGCTGAVTEGEKLQRDKAISHRNIDFRCWEVCVD